MAIFSLGWARKYLGPYKCQIAFGAWNALISLSSIPGGIVPAMSVFVAGRANSKATN